MLYLYDQYCLLGMISAAATSSEAATIYDFCHCVEIPRIGG